MSGTSAFDIQAMVREFHRTFGVPTPDEPKLFGYPKQLRVDLIQEELDEFSEALADGDMVSAIDALGDLAYVVFGAAEAMGVELAPFVAEIHRSNMTKVGGGRREDSKILKGPNYEPPEIRALLVAMYGEEVLP